MNKVNVYRTFIFLILVLLLAGCGSGKPNDLNWKVGTIHAVNQDGQPFELSSLRGKVWIADFIFTNCITVCQPMTLNMTRLQNEMHEQKLDAEIVSFSVDPEVDTPEALATYIGRFGGSLNNWHLLTGYSPEEIQTFAKESFNSTVIKDPNSDQVIHGTSFFLVDQTGTVVKKYNGVEPPYDEIIRDVKALLK